MKWLSIFLVILVCYILFTYIVQTYQQHNDPHGVKVSSQKYDLMLRALLSRTTPEVDIAHLSKNYDSYTLLDARSRTEYEVSHLPHAHWIGYDDFEVSRLQSIDKEQAIIIYCSVGYRSEKMTQRLLAMGFKNVANLYGGLFEWMNEGHRVVNLSGQMTDQIHAYNKVWGLWVTQGQKVY